MESDLRLIGAGYLSEFCWLLIRCVIKNASTNYYLLS